MKSIKFYKLLAISLCILMVSSSQTNRDNPFKKKVFELKEKIWQRIPKFTRFFPVLMIRAHKKDTSSIPLNLKDLTVDVSIVGNIATTTFHMTFYNDSNRIMEGQLYFPLGEGKTISRFAMDVNGKLREGVVVEKAKGRTVFEKIVRRRVDPGLLEWTQGNNFKARVYPIPAKGTKKIVIAYEQDLIHFNKNKTYILPFGFKQKVNKFTLNIDVLNAHSKPKLAYNEIKKLKFKKQGKHYIARMTVLNYVPNKQVGITISSNKQAPKYYTETINNQQYVYINTQPKIYGMEKEKPSSIGILWDVSGSGYHRNIDKELDILKGYLKGFDAVNVEIVTFSNTIINTKKIVLYKGKYEPVLSYLKNRDYDGGTQLGALDLSKYPASEYLLFSDGMSNFGKSAIKTNNKVVYTITSTLVSDYAYLQQLANNTGGTFLNANRLNTQTIVDQLNSTSYTFISATFNKEHISEDFPKNKALTFGGLQWAAKLNAVSTSITLNYGFGNTIYTSETIDISSTNMDYKGSIRKIWAQKKLNTLDINHAKNKKIITKLGKDFGIITRFTSLIILDNLADYIEHKIVPPKEWQKEYFAKIGQLQQTELKDQETQTARVLKLLKVRNEWWKKTVVVKKTKKQTSVNRNDQDDHYSTSGAFYDSTIVVLDVSRISVVRDATRSTSEQIRLANLSSRFHANSQGADGPDNDSRGSGAGATPNRIRIVEDRLSFANAPPGLTINANGQELESNGDGVEGGFDGEVNERRANNIRVVPVHCPTFSSEDKKEELNRKPLNQSTIKVKVWDSKATYIKTLKTKSPNKLWATYLLLKKEYSNSPAFYMDVAQYFISLQDTATALRILSNLAELETENHQLLRILAYRLSEIKAHELAISTFVTVAKLKEEEPQSFRDLGLAYASNHQPQKAIENLYKVVTTKWDSRFPNIELIALTEINSMINNNKQTVNTAFINSKLINNLPVDIRVVLNWDTDNCDIDLWVTDPNGEKCFYSHKNTNVGGLMSNDFTRGYGPEVFLLKKAIKGTYKIEANYYGTSSQKQLAPVTLKLQFYTHHGTTNQTVKEVILRLKKSKEVVEIAEIAF